MVYPNYIDSTKTVAEGRMISKAAGEAAWGTRHLVSLFVYACVTPFGVTICPCISPACPNPNVVEMMEACEALKLPAQIEVGEGVQRWLPV